jgi:hypothetical protein
MKRQQIAIAVLAAALAAQPLVSAAQVEKPAAKPRAGMQVDPKMQQQMTDRMKTMQAQMEKIRQTTDPKEREKLLAEHMKSMQEGMQMMRGMGGGMMGMMGGGMGAGMGGFWGFWGGGGGGGGGGANDGRPARHRSAKRANDAGPHGHDADDDGADDAARSDEAADSREMTAQSEFVNLEHQGRGARAGRRRAGSRSSLACGTRVEHRRHLPVVLGSSLPCWGG